MWHFKCKGDRSLPRRLHHATGCRHSIWNPFCKRWRATAWPRGGYELARERRLVSANDILRAAGSVEDTDERPAASELVNKVVLPTLASAEHEFGVALGRINLDDMARDTETLGVCAGSDPRR